MGCCPNGVYPPLIRECSGLIRPIHPGEILSIHGEHIPKEILTDDLTIYIDPAGNDLSGNGTVSKPFASIYRAHNEVLKYDPGIYDITISVGDGVYTLDRTFSPSWLYGGHVFIIGNSSILATVADPATMTSADTAATTGDYTELQYFDFELQIDTYFNSYLQYVQEDLFIFIQESSGGTNSPAIRGLHKIIGWDAGTRTVTLRAWQKENVVELPSGAVTATSMTLIRAVFKSDDALAGHSISTYGIHAGRWGGIVIEGNDTQYASYRGVVVQSSGCFDIYLGPFGIHGFKWGLYVNEAFASYQNAAISKIFENAVVLAGGASVPFGYASGINGCGSCAFWLYGGSVADAWTVKVVASAKSYNNYIEGGSFANFDSAKFYYEDPGVTVSCLHATKMANIYCYSAGFTGFTTNKSTSLGGTIYPP